MYPHIYMYFTFYVTDQHSKTLNNKQEIKHSIVGNLKSSLREWLTLCHTPKIKGEARELLVRKILSSPAPLWKAPLCLKIHRLQDAESLAASQTNNH